MENFVICHITVHRWMRDRAQPLQIAVDDDDVPSGVVEEARYLTPDSPPPANDHVPVHAGDVSLHPAPPDELSHVSLDEHLEHGRERVQRRAHTQEDECDCETLASRAERMRRVEPDGRDGDHRLIDGVDEIEPEQQIADGASQEHQRQSQQANSHPPERIHSIHHACSTRPRITSMSVASRRASR